jgi:hypothetical protein
MMLTFVFSKNLNRPRGNPVHDLICSPDPGPKWMLDFYVRIGIREGAENVEESVHGGSDRLCPAPSTPLRRVTAVSQKMLKRA